MANTNMKNQIGLNELTKTQIASDSALSYPQTTSSPLDIQLDVSRREIESYISKNRAQPKGNSGTDLSPYGLNREPWVFATFESITNAGAGSDISAPQFSNRTDGYNTKADTIFWVASPRSVSWQIGQRAVEDKNKSGTVLHVWRDRSRKTDYDDPKIIMQFQSGNIGPRGERAVPGGLTNFYQFLSLVDQPKIASTGEPNLIHILYRSRIFPAMVITGFFDPQMVVQFVDDSANPWQVNAWQASFTVYNTTPRLNSFTELTQRFEADGLKFDNPSNLQGERIDVSSANTGQFRRNFE